MNAERRTNYENDKAQMEFLKKNVDLERIFKNEIKELNIKIDKLERFGKDLATVKNNQTKTNEELRSELKVVQENFKSQQKVFKEMDTKVKWFASNQHTKTDENQR